MKIDIESIRIRPDRQRKDLGSLEDMKKSILNVGTLINPIVIEQDSADGLFYLVAGERRLTAWKALASEGLIEREIPATLFSELDEVARQLIELEENVKRKDLTWQEHIEAMMKLAELKGFDTDEEFADYIGTSISDISRNKTIWAMKDNEKVWGAENKSNAYTICRRESARILASAKNDLNFMLENFLNEETGEKNTKSGEGNKPAVIASTEPFVVRRAEQAPTQNTKGEPEKEAFAQYQIIQGDFKEWVQGYKGKPFTLVHLDFPYGINHQKSKQGNTASFGTYQDSEDIYIELVNTLLENQDKFISDTAHCVCWLSLKFAEWTKKRFKEAGWDCLVQPFIWHKSDNKGIVADPLCGMRNVGEYALIFNRGRLPVLKNISNIFSSPTTKVFHASEKPLPVLEYLFSAFCDSSSRVLDPTCGSGTAIQMALKYGAEEGLGIELDGEFAEKAKESLELAKKTQNLMDDFKLEF